MQVSSCQITLGAEITDGNIRRSDWQSGAPRGTRDVRRVSRGQPGTRYVRSRSKLLVGGVTAIQGGDSRNRAYTHVERKQTRLKPRKPFNLSESQKRECSLKMPCFVCWSGRRMLGWK